MASTHADDLAARLLLYSLPSCGPNRAAWLSQHPGNLKGAVSAIRRSEWSEITADKPKGVTPDLLARWSRLARQIDEHKLLEAHQTGGVVLSPGHGLWRFDSDPHPPLFLHAIGKTQLLEQRPAVGIVGTRRCTNVGRRFAQQLGAELAEAGVAVVSGLAKGVDGAAHRGTLAASGSAIAVVASGLDVIYPRSNERLWHQIAGSGLLLSEAPLGTHPERWRFPARNRIIAALSDIVVVVESHATGGALSTASEAAARGVPVGAVPGSVSSAAASGTNGLLADGCIPIRHCQDVLDALGIFLSPQQSLDVVPKTHMPLGREAQRIMDEVQAGSVHIDTLLPEIGIPLPRLMAMLASMTADGLVIIDGSTIIGAAKASVNPPPPQVRL